LASQARAMTTSESLFVKVHQQCFDYRAVHGVHPTQLRIHPESYVDLLSFVKPYMLPCSFSKPVLGVQFMGMELVKTLMVAKGEVVVE